MILILIFYIWFRQKFIHEHKWILELKMIIQYSHASFTLPEIHQKIYVYLHFNVKHILKSIVIYSCKFIIFQGRP